jgi:hypothetical protein
MPWGVIFPGAGPEPRHPSQLYEAVLEGLVLFIVLQVMARGARDPASPPAGSAVPFSSATAWRGSSSSSSVSRTGISVISSE